MVLDGRALVWLAWGEGRVYSVAVTTIAVNEWRKVCEIVACGGKEMCRWLHFIERLEDYARTEGCSAMRIFGRRGWTRILASYRVKRVILEKDL